MKDSSVDEARSRRIPHHAEVVEVPERLFQVVDEREEVLDRVEVHPKSFQSKGFKPQLCKCGTNFLNERNFLPTSFRFWNKVSVNLFYRCDNLTS